MIRKRIGILLAQAEEKNQSAFIEGFLNKAFALDFDVCVFSMHTRLQGTKAREMGDSNIYNLVIPGLFDAMVIMADTIQTPGVMDKIYARLKRDFKGPVLVVDKESEDYPSIMIDHYTPMLGLINHLIDVHGYKDIVFISGYKNHIHSIQREQAFVDGMKLHGLVVTPDMIYHGNYWYDSGTNIMKEILDSRDTLPEAVACANDYMAIGAATELERRGYVVPDDIALIGYDSVEEGKESPVSLTSADIPAKSCGKSAAKYIYNMLNDQPSSGFSADAPLVIGGSCGCKVRENMYYLGRRKTWETDISALGYNSYYNYIMENLLSQTEIKSFYSTLFQYVNQLRDFESFHICINSFFMKDNQLIEQNQNRTTYSDKIYRVIKCGPDENIDNCIDFEDSFDKNILLPELNEYRDKPTAFFFTPLYFDNTSYGYSCISYGDKAKCYDDTYRNWSKDVMQSLESFYRQATLQILINRFEASQIRDSLTGLYNYKGMIKRSKDLCNPEFDNSKTVDMIAIDLNGLKAINAKFGRDVGDDALQSLAWIINECINKDEIGARLSNSEYVIVAGGENSTERANQIIEGLNCKIADFNVKGGVDYTIAITFGQKTGELHTTEDFEKLLNDTVILKNAKKTLIEKAMIEEKHEKEEHENDKIVKDILDNNKITYHFQPIVSAKNGKIIAYEALMRSKHIKNIPPTVVLESAERMGRLYEVEKATFFNVIDYIEKNATKLLDKKVFINSIPGYQLKGKDKEELAFKMRNHFKQIVVELTEETEIGDAQLQELKNNYLQMNIDTAIDDYGAGYSNVNNLLRYMPRYVKIDRALMTNINKDPQKQHFVKDIIEFAHDNDILALAEGVEQSEELKEVIKLGVDLIQGYYTCKPQPKMIDELSETIVNEIVQFNQLNNTKYNKKVYDVVEQSSISLVQLALNKYSALHIDKNNGDVEVLGAQGFLSNLVIKVGTGYEGSITLKNVSLSGYRGIPCIDIEDNCKVNIILEGDNELSTGGIRVPESSAVTFHGDGNLNIKVNSGKYYAIGNDINSRNGDIVFDQDGGIIIDANGMKGVGIGSGLGGKITIKRGHYELDVKGQEGVCIGAISGDVKLNIDYCDMDIYSGISNGTIIGSYEKNAEIFMENVSAKISGSANITTGIGTYSGGMCNVHIKNANVSLNIRASECYAIGSKKGITDIVIEYASVTAVTQGKAAYAFGNCLKSARIKFVNSDTTTQVMNNLGVDIGAMEEDIDIENGRINFYVNGEQVERPITFTTF